MSDDVLSLLPAVIDAARTAGQRVAEEFTRAAGPRFSDHVTAPIDHEVELFLRDRLLALLPARFVGEEAGVLAAEPNGYCWVVDPHDGTRAYLEGKRGSAVSVALLRRGQPVLGVVYAPLSPDRGPDMIAWAEGAAGLTRNGVPVPIDLRGKRLEPGDVVFLNHGAWQRPVWNGIACAPGRFMPLPSIAYRLARVAVGDGVATQTLRPVNALDIAAGHALLLAAGGVLVAEDGTPVTYSEQGESRPSACFGGPPAVVVELRGRAWRGSTEPRRAPRVTLNFPRRVDEAMLDRGAGCLLGLAVGDAAAQAGRDAGEGAASDPGTLPAWRDGGPLNTLAGQPTGRTELALALARTLIGLPAYDADSVAAAYAAWLASGPFDCGVATGRAFAAAAGRGQGHAAAMREAADAASQGNDALARVAPIGVWRAGDPGGAAAAAMADAALSHPHPVSAAACGALAAAIAAGVAGADAAGMQAAAQAVARQQGSEPVGAALAAAAREAPSGFAVATGNVLLALHNAFWHLAAGHAAAAALAATVAAGGDTAGNAAVTGALLGAAQGRTAFPPHWTLTVLTCRPDSGLAVVRPRPEAYWPDDLIDLAEALLLRQPRFRPGQETA